jgi:hypothetical protein
MEEEGLKEKVFVSYICADRLPNSANELVDNFFSGMEQGTRVVGVNNIQVSQGPIGQFPPADPPCNHWRLVTILAYTAQESSEHYMKIAGDIDKIKQEGAEKIANLVRSSIQ